MELQFTTRVNQALAKMAHERREKMTPELITHFPSIVDMKTKVILGSFSWTMPFIRRRFIDSANCIDIFGVEQTPTEISRDYLRVVFPDRLRATGAQVEELRKQKTHPLYANPCVIESAAYVDLKSAYWSIMNAVGWNVDYFPNKFLAKGRGVEDFPLPNHKPARNSLVSMGLPSASRIWTGNGFETEHTNNPNLNLGIYRLVQDVLHTIAWRAIELGAKYVHTDGYILPIEQADNLVYYIGEWGLTAKIKETGRAQIYAAGAYSIGDHKIQRIVHGYTPHAYIHPENEKWLLPRFARLKAFSNPLLDV
jgi:hypothetical protein